MVSSPFCPWHVIRMHLQSWCRRPCSVEPRSPAGREPPACGRHSCCCSPGQLTYSLLRDAEWEDLDLWPAKARAARASLLSVSVRKLPEEAHRNHWTKSGRAVLNIMVLQEESRSQEQHPVSGDTNRTHLLELGPSLAQALRHCNSRFRIGFMCNSEDATQGSASQIGAPGLELWIHLRLHLPHKAHLGR